MQVPQLYRGFSAGVKYIGFDWRASTYLTDDFETAAIYGRLGKVQRASFAGDVDAVFANDPIVRRIEESPNPALEAERLGVQVIWNQSASWEGKVHPHELVVFTPGIVKFKPLTKPEQIRASRIAQALADLPG